MSNYFDVIKINRREILHLHYLIWLADNLKFHNLQDQLQNNFVFADQIIDYLKFIIKYSINLIIKNLENLETW